MRLSRLVQTLVLLMLIMVSACDSDSKLRDEIDAIDIDIQAERFDLAAAKTSADELPRLKEAFPFMFSGRISDSVYIQQMNDSIQTMLNDEVSKAFPEFPEELDISSFYRHLKYYDKSFRTPRLVTVISRVDYRNKTIAADTIDLISLDTYLGPDHEFYSGIQAYIRQNFRREMIVSDLAQAHAENRIRRGDSKAFLNDMIYHGKILYFKDLMLAETSDADKIGYTEDEWAWAEANESSIWRYFIENELLYSSDPKLAGRFINPAPFSKFGLELDNESPGSTGRYIGWQIVRSYMENNETKLMDMLRMPFDEIFNNSKYKPKR